MLCDYCGNEHDGKYASGRFCSEKCARGFSTKSKRENINKRVSLKLRKIEYFKTKCEFCGNEYQSRYHYKTFGSGRFCSRKCACSFASSFSDSSGRLFTDDDRKLAKEVQKAHRRYRLDHCNFDELSHGEKRQKVFEEQEGKCAICGISDWQGKKLVLEFHHKDGNKRNESRDNVVFICPNCHSQTSNDTHKGSKHSLESRNKIKEGLRRYRESIGTT